MGVINMSLSLWCRLEDEKYWICTILKYVRTHSSSSEWYDWAKIQPWMLCCSDMRNWELKLLINSTRETIVMRVDEKLERIDDKNIFDTFTVLWHRLYLWRCLQFLYDNAKKKDFEWLEYRNEIYKFIDLWKLKDKPLDEQDNKEKIIDLILSLDWDDK